MPDQELAPTPSAPLAFTITVSGRSPSTWTLILHPDRLELVPSPVPMPAPEPGSEANPWSPPAPVPAGSGPGPTAYERTAYGSGFWLDEGLVVRRAFFFRTPAGTRNALLSPDVFRAVDAWIGPRTPSMLAAELRRRTQYLAPIALFSVVSNLACPSGPDATQQQIVGVGLGLGLGVIFLLARFLPHPGIFLLDALWWIACIASNVHGILRQGLHWGWWVFIVACVFFLVDELRLYRRFSRRRGSTRSEA